MARTAHEREDLLRDARALVPRVQLRVQLDGRDAALFAGFRGASLTLYFGPDPVFHFNEHGELRRAFVRDRLVKAEDGRLIGLARVALPQQTELRAMPFDDAEQRGLIADLRTRLAQLREALAAGTFEVEGQVADDAGEEAVTRLRAWLDNHANVAIANRPHVR